MTAGNSLQQRETLQKVPYASLGGTNVQSKAQVLSALAQPTRTGPAAGNLALGSKVVTIVPAGGGDSMDPTLRMTATGRLVMMYRNATTHAASASGSLMWTYSDDLGKTWATPVAFVHDAGGIYDSRDPFLTIMPDGSWMVSYFTSRQSDGRQIAMWVIKSTNGGSTWGTPVQIPFTFTYSTANNGPVVRLANGDLIAAAYGRNASGDNNSCRVMKSTDGGLTWGSEVTVADGVALGRKFEEPNLGLLADGTTLMCLLRSDSPVPKNIYRSTSTDGGATWSAPAAVLSGGGRPTWILLASGAILCTYRYAATDFDFGSYPAMWRTSWDSGVTWTAENFIENSAYESVYASPCEVTSGVVAMAYAMESLITDGTIKFRYLLDGYGVSPLGDTTSARNAVTVTADYTMSNGDEIVLADASSRTVTDGVTTNGSPTITSATLASTISDLKRKISGTNVPAATTVVSIVSATSARMSANATGTGSGLTLTVGGALTVTLPPVFAGRRVTVTKTDSSVNVVTVTGTGVSMSLATPNQTVDLISDGTSWFVLSNAVPNTAVDALGWGVAFTFRPLNYAGSTAYPSANRAYAYRVEGGATITKIGVYCAVSSGNISVATLTGPAGLSPPTTRTQTSGAVACPGTGYAEVSLGGSIAVAAPTGWFAISADNTTCSFGRTGLPNLGVTAIGSGTCYQLDTAHPIPASPAFSSASWTIGYIMVGRP